jgi:hypothetical protein
VTSLVAESGQLERSVADEPADALIVPLADSELTPESWVLRPVQTRELRA